MSYPRVSLPLHQKLSQIPRGDTCRGVNRIVIENLLAHFEGRDFTILDIACGDGSFLDAVLRLMPDAITYGSDRVEPTSAASKHTFLPTDLEVDTKPFNDGPFDAITCISGLMEYDNTLTFLQRIRRSIRADGIVLLTNDNLLSVRDRLLYLLQGRFGQYPFNVKTGSPTWKILPLQNLIRLIDQAGFRIDSISYAPPSLTDGLWFPLALPLFALQRLTVPALSLYLPLNALISRHYVLVCRPI